MIELEGKSAEELRELNAKGLVRRVDIPEYSVWNQMKHRCGNPDHARYRDWGGRGIKVCPEWNEDFFAWLEHIGRRPRVGLTLDRIDNQRGYEPGNVQWDTYKAQSSNRRAQTWHNKTSRYCGVSWYHRGDKWRAQVRISGRGQLYLGLYANETDAAIAYNYHVGYLGLDLKLNEIRAEDYIHD